MNPRIKKPAKLIPRHAVWELCSLNVLQAGASGKICLNCEKTHVDSQGHLFQSFSDFTGPVVEAHAIPQSELDFKAAALGPQRCIGAFLVWDQFRTTSTKELGHHLRKTAECCFFIFGTINLSGS